MMGRLQAMNAKVITANSPATYPVALPSPKYDPLPATAQNTRSPGPTRSATTASGIANAVSVATTPRRPRHFQAR